MNNKTRTGLIAGVAGSVISIVINLLPTLVLHNESLSGIMSVFALAVAAGAWAFAYRQLLEGLRTSPLRSVHDGRALTEHQRALLLSTVVLTCGDLWLMGSQAGVLAGAAANPALADPVATGLRVGLVALLAAIIVAGWAHFANCLKNDDSAWRA